MRQTLKWLIAIFCSFVAGGVTPASTNELQDKIASNDVGASNQIHLVKNFKKKPIEFRDVAPGLGGCIATDRITVDGARVGYMYREEPSNGMDSGWRFTAGDETEAYMDDPNHHEVYDVNTIANYDTEIVPFLSEPVGTRVERGWNGKLRILKPEE